MPNPSRDSEAVLPLLEEELAVGKRSVETGKVRISTRVREREELVAQTLHGEEVDVVRVPKDTVVSEPPSVRQEGDTTIIPVVEEVLFVEKRLVVREEIHVRKRRTIEEVAQQVALRAETAVVEREEASDPGQSSSKIAKE